MPDLWCDVDTAVTVPVNVMPLISDSDFTTIDEGIAYNESGMDLNWNFQTTAGVTTQTNVVPTTGDDHDWTHSGNGMYKIELPASGGDVDNDAEGIGWFSGVCDAVLPWRGPIIGFRAAALNNALIDGGDVLDVSLTEINGVAQRATDLAEIAQYLFANAAVLATVIDDDAVMAQLLASGGDISEYDDTEHSQEAIADAVAVVDSKVDSIAVTGSALSQIAESYTLTLGTQTTGTFAATHALDFAYHGITRDGAGDTDFYYVFNITTDSTPVNVNVTGRLDEGSLPSGNDIVDLYARDFVAVGWEKIHPTGFVGVANSTSANDETLSATLFAKHVNASGEVWIRLAGASLEASTEMLVDQGAVAYALAQSRVGYANGQIWVDTVSGAAGTVAFVNGTADNPVLTWADALTLSGTTGLIDFHIGNGSSIQLTGAATNYTMSGHGWSLDLNGQSIDGLDVSGAEVTGTGTNGATDPEFHDCCFGTVTLPPCKAKKCGVGVGGGTFTAQAAGQYLFDECFSEVPGSGTPSFVFTGLGSATGINNRGWKGGATYTLDSDDTLSHEVVVGGGTTVTTGGADVEIRGITRSVTITASAAETIQFVGITGPITLGDDGASTATITLYGVSTSVTDNTNGATVNDLTVSETDQTIIAGDVAGLDGAAMRGTDGANTVVPDVAGTAAGLHTTTDGLLGTPVALDSGIATLAGMLTKMADNNGGADFTAGTDSLQESRDTIVTSLLAQAIAIGNIPTNAEFNARTILSAAYFDPANDTVALVTALSATGLNNITVSVDGDQLTIPEAVRLMTRHTDGDWSIAGVTLTHEDDDGDVATYTLDDATNPTSRTKD